MMQNIEHIIDSNLTRENARNNLEKQKIAVTVYENRINEASVVHSHPYHELILPLSGSEVVYSVAGGLYVVQLGELIYIPCETYHSARFHVTDHHSERLVIQIADGIWKEAQNHLGKLSVSWMNNLAILKQEEVSHWNLQGLIERITQSMQLRFCYQHIVLTAQIVELQTLMTQIMETSNPIELGNTSELIQRAVAYLQNHYQEPDLNVTRLAKEIFMSREHLSRAFKKYTMESVHSYLTNLRMQNCLRMLAAGESVKNACSGSGFSDYTSFLKTFQHLYGTSPSRYQINIKI